MADMQAERLFYTNEQFVQASIFKKKPVSTES